jgi:hypothetical protein
MIQAMAMAVLSACMSFDEHGVVGGCPPAYGSN